jgi:hypothetical protein
VVRGYDVYLRRKYMKVGEEDDLFLGCGAA